MSPAEFAALARDLIDAMDAYADGVTSGVRVNEAKERLRRALVPEGAPETFAETWIARCGRVGAEVRQHRGEPCSECGDLDGHALRAPVDGGAVTRDGEETKR